MSIPERALYKDVFLFRDHCVRVDRYAYHQYRTATIESSHVRVLPDILDVVGIRTDKTFLEILEGTLNRFGVSLQRPFTPSDSSISSLDANEQPSRRHAKIL